MIDLQKDRLEPVAKLAERMIGKRISPATVWRWCLKGCKVGDSRIRLEAVKCAGQWHSTPAALAAFIRAQTASLLKQNEEARVVRDERTTERLKKVGLL